MSRGCPAACWQQPRHHRTARAWCSSPRHASRRGTQPRERVGVGTGTGRQHAPLATATPTVSRRTDGGAAIPISTTHSPLRAQLFEAPKKLPKLDFLNLVIIGVEEFRLCV